MPFLCATRSVPAQLPFLPLFKPESPSYPRPWLSISHYFRWQGQFQSVRTLSGTVPMQSPSVCCYFAVVSGYVTGCSSSGSFQASRSRPQRLGGCQCLCARADTAVITNFSAAPAARIREHLSSHLQRIQGSGVRHAVDSGAFLLWHVSLRLI